MAPKPPAIADLVWSGDLRFDVSFARPAGGASDGVERAPFVLDSAGAAGPSPVEALGAALAGCMSIDLAHMLSRGRHAFRGLRSRLIGSRAPDMPHRLVALALHFIVEGDVPDEPIDRAIRLSRGKYCSVWHSLRQDIPLDVTFEVLRPSTTVR